MRQRCGWSWVCVLVVGGCARGSSTEPGSPTSDHATDDGGGATHDASTEPTDATTQPAPDSATPDASSTADSTAGDGASAPDGGVVPDGASGSDGAPGPDGGEAGVDASTGCGEYTGDTSFTCSKDGNARGKCVGGSATVEMCPRGCLREPTPQDSICMGTTDNWSCNGSYGTQRALNGDYDITSFGCWVDPSGNVHTDPDDNCIPSCLSQAIAAGLCKTSDTGPSCEERINWFTADAARFGCLQRVRVTNPATGKAVIAVALDLGPSCSVESVVSMGVLDSSGRIDLELFGGDQGVSDQSLVHVVEVDDSTPLGPVP